MTPYWSSTGFGTDFDVAVTHSLVLEDRPHRRARRAARAIMIRLRAAVRRRSVRAGAMHLLLACCAAAAAYGQTTVFTYQGQLSDGGTLANGSYDVRFALFDGAEGGAQIGTNQTVAAVPVNEGVFTVQLDFGVNAFPGANRFMEISVRPAGAGAYTT